MYTSYAKSSLTVYQTPKSATGERRVVSISRHETRETIDLQEQENENAAENDETRNNNTETATTSQRLMQNAEQRGFVRRLLKQCSELASIERRKLWPTAELQQQKHQQQRSTVADIVLDRYAIVFVDQLIRVAFRLITSSPIRPPGYYNANNSNNNSSSSNCDLHDVEQIFSEGTLGFMADDLAQTIYEELFLLALRVLACHEKNIKKADCSGQFENRPEMLIFVTVFSSSSSSSHSSTPTPADSDTEGGRAFQPPQAAGRNSSNDSRQSCSTLNTSELDELEICTRGDRAMEAFAQLLLQQIVTYADNLADRAQKFVESVFAESSNNNSPTVPPATNAANAAASSSHAKQQNVASADNVQEESYAADDIRRSTPKWEHNHLPDQTQTQTRTARVKNNNAPFSYTAGTVSPSKPTKTGIDAAVQKQQRRSPVVKRRSTCHSRVMSPGADAEMEQMAFENSLVEVVSSEKLCSIIIGEVMYKSYAVYNRELRQLADLPADLPALLLVKGSADMLQVKAMLRHALCDPTIPSSSTTNLTSTASRSAANSGSGKLPPTVVTTNSTSSALQQSVDGQQATTTAKVRTKKAKQTSALDIQQQQEPSTKPVRRKQREVAVISASEAAAAAAAISREERLYSNPSKQQQQKTEKQQKLTTTNRYSNKSSTQLTSSATSNGDNSWEKQKSSTVLSQKSTTPVIPSASKKRKRKAQQQQQQQSSAHKLKNSKSRLNTNSKRRKTNSRGVPFSSSFARQDEIRRALTTAGDEQRPLRLQENEQRPLSVVVCDMYEALANVVRRIVNSLPPLLLTSPAIAVEQSTAVSATTRRLVTEQYRETSTSRRITTTTVSNSSSAPSRPLHPNDIVIPAIAAVVALVICWKALRKLDLPCFFRCSAPQPPSIIHPSNYQPQPSSCWFHFPPLDALGAPTTEAAAPHVLGVARR